MNLYVDIAVLVVVLCVGGYGMHRIDQVPYQKLEAQFADYKAQTAALAEQAQQAYADGLAKQLKDYQGTLAHNAQVMTELQNENLNVTADRDFARKLLDALRAADAASHSAAAAIAGGGSSAPGLPEASGDGSLIDLVSDVSGECREAMQRLAGLQDEIIPQTSKVTP